MFVRGSVGQDDEDLGQRANALLSTGTTTMCLSSGIDPEAADEDEKHLNLIGRVNPSDFSATLKVKNKKLLHLNITKKKHSLTWVFFFSFSFKE